MIEINKPGEQPANTMNGYEIPQDISEEVPQTEEQRQEEILKTLQARYGKVQVLKVPLDDDGNAFAYAYLKKIDRVVMLMIIGKMKDNMVEGLELLLKNSVIPEATDPRIYGPESDDDLYISAVLKMEHTLTFRKAELKKN